MLRWAKSKAIRRPSGPNSRTMSSHMPMSSTRLPSTKPPSNPSSPQGRISSEAATTMA